ncbi:hypothetical protein Bca52824_024979 [Brassica carinata]|uniref:Uncharacterized protein n=1 Tax=Brassica carinata TaxID=52824 RepID=A0A8X8AXC1_BRACI|nr:hypothetical protein Bca52824_024979 [Brassica carinata]
MSDGVLKKGDSNTLSNKELDAAVLPPDQPINELTPPSYVDSNTLSVRELDAFLPPPYKQPSAQGHGDFFYPPPYPYPRSVFELSHRPGPTTSVDHVGSWSPVIVHLPPTPQDELERNLKKFFDDVLPPEVPPVDVDELESPDMFDCLHPSQIEYRRTFVPPFTPCPPYSPPAPGGYNYSRSQDTFHAKPLLFAKIALHCYNLEKGTHFERLGWGLDLPRSYEQTDLFTLEAMDPVLNHPCKFETNVRLATENKDCFHVITTRCRTLPPPPPPEEKEKEESGFDTLSVDELFRGNMPDWLPDDSKLQYYEMKESEVEQAKEWLHLYAEIALYTKKQTDPFKFEHSKPLELGKVFVQTRGVVDSKEEVMKLDNAVFFISFKTSCGDFCKGIIRRTRDGNPEHLSLEAKCFM